MEKPAIKTSTWSSDYDLRRETLMRQARRFVAGQFAPKSAEELIDIVGAGTEESGVRTAGLRMLGHGCSLCSGRAAARKLVYDTRQEMYFLYAKIQPYLHEFRRQMNLPEWMRNIESLVERTPEGRERVAGMRKIPTGH